MDLFEFGRVVVISPSGLTAGIRASSSPSDIGEVRVGEEEEMITFVMSEPSEISRDLPYGSRL